MAMSRRRALRGMGVLMGLPVLEAMKPFSLRAGMAGKQARDPAPVRLAFLYMPNGVNPAAWSPGPAGLLGKFPPAMAPLEKVRSDVLVLSNLWNERGFRYDAHVGPLAGFLTSSAITPTSGLKLNVGGPSVDQIAASALGNRTKLPSIELSVEPPYGYLGTGALTLIYASTVSWSTATSPVMREINPRAAFERVFSDGTQASGLSRFRGSVVDRVQDDAQSLASSLGRADKLKIEEYLHSVRAIERRIEFEEAHRGELLRQDPGRKKALADLEVRIARFESLPWADGLQSIDHTEHVRLMLDIAALAFWTDTTRVASFMFGNAFSHRNFSFLPGVNGLHHTLSHHENAPEALEQYKRINIWHTQQLAYFIERLKSLPEGQGSLLDNCGIVLGSAMRDGNGHTQKNLPIIVAGKCGGAISPGRHLACAKDTPLANLWKSLLGGAGVPVERFGDSTGELAKLNEPA
jgi:hypothetical protein